MSNILSTIYKKEVINTIPKKAIVHYQISETIPLLTDSTSLIELNIPGQVIDLYVDDSNMSVDGDASIINLKSLNISSESDKFNVKILNINDVSKLNTINEMWAIDDIVKSNYVAFSTDMIISNKDIAETSKMYLYIENTSNTLAIENIEVEIVYEILKNI